MFTDRKINAVSSVVTAVMTFIGVSSALVYYLSLDAGKDWFDKFITLVIFSSIILATLVYTKRRLEYET